MAEKISVVVVTPNKRLKELISLYLGEIVDFELLDEFSDNSEIYNTLSAVSKSVLLADMSAPIYSLIEDVAADCPNCCIVGIKENPDVNFIVKAVRLGVKEILSYPVIKTEFSDLMKRIRESFITGYQKPGKCKMISVFSNKGGIGKTSVAVNLAYELAQITKENVALIDLNFQFGDVATFMDLQPTFDIPYMFSNLGALNKDFLLSTMEKYKNTSLYVLADPPYFKQAQRISTKQLSLFFEVLKGSFSYIVVDTEANFDAKTVTTLDYSDMVFLVTVVNLPALRNCQRCLELFDKLGYENDKVQILVNRYMENDEITVDEAEELLKKNIYWKIPNNYFSLMASINKGILLSELNPSSNVAQSFKELAIHVADSVFRNRLIKRFSNDSEERLNNALRSWVYGITK